MAILRFSDSLRDLKPKLKDHELIAQTVRVGRFGLRPVPDPHLEIRWGGGGGGGLGLVIQTLR